ncbi:uncharacterized protein LOC116655369 [Drosophila ananassae]|uniref:uncharacterized protein LOC116655369 n=1 Tax=Drosophila ananassae TaxID=7217 RepID=UPI0013A5EC28|nr:uncharacterized protein LOC116655369 [Drosophila ananassae]
MRRADCFGWGAFTPSALSLPLTQSLTGKDHFAVLQLQPALTPRWDGDLDNNLSRQRRRLRQSSSRGGSSDLLSNWQLQWSSLFARLLELFVGKCPVYSSCLLIFQPKDRNRTRVPNRTGAELFLFNF